MDCLDVVATLVTENRGDMPNLTDMERIAIKAARPPLYHALLKINRAAGFDDATGDEMDSVIEAIWNACRASLRDQNRGANHAAVGDGLDDEIPF